MTVYQRWASHQSHLHIVPNAYSLSNNYCYSFVVSRTFPQYFQVHMKVTEVAWLEFTCLQVWKVRLWAERCGWFSITAGHVELVSERAAFLCLITTPRCLSAAGPSGVSGSAQWPVVSLDSFQVWMYLWMNCCSLLKQRALHSVMQDKILVYSRFLHLVSKASSLRSDWRTPAQTFDIRTGCVRHCEYL